MWAQGRRLFPVKPAGDHQMQDQPPFIFKPETDSFAESSQRQNLFAFDGGDWRRSSAQQEGRVELNALERVINNADFKRFQVNSYIRELGHERKNFDRIYRIYKMRRGSLINCSNEGILASIPLA